MRDESSYSIGLLGSIAETIQIAREAHIAVNISHIKALGADVWGKSGEAIAMIRKARAEGLHVTADQYPYSASGSSLTASLAPAWALDGGTPALIARFDDAATKDRVRAEMKENMRRRGGEDSFLLLSPRDAALRGKRLGEVARGWKKDPVEAAIEIIRNGGSAVASFNMTEPDIEAFMKEDWVMTCSDGSGGHPRKYGTFPRKLRRYVYERKTIGLEFMVRQSAGLTADTFKLKDRGYLRTGYFADLIVFDPKTVADVATYEEPERLSTGMKFVFVNGRAAVEDGKFTGTLAGVALKR
jgi:N-acyl-D-aspartate/D-glutamate deacylase